MTDKKTQPSDTPAEAGAGSTPDPSSPPGAELEAGEAKITGGTPELQQAVVAAIQTCYDPEIPVDIYVLGLIYGIAIDDECNVEVDMTLTSPNCPVAGSLPGEVEQTIASVSGVSSAQVSVVWDPPWGPERMSEAARLQLGLF